MFFRGRWENWSSGQIKLSANSITRQLEKTDNDRRSWVSFTLIHLEIKTRRHGFLGSCINTVWFHQTRWMFYVIYLKLLVSCPTLIRRGPCQICKMIINLMASILSYWLPLVQFGHFWLCVDWERARDVTLLTLRWLWNEFWLIFRACLITMVIYDEFQR